MFRQFNFFIKKSLSSVPEPMVKRIVYQTLLAVNFCHQHHVSKIWAGHSKTYKMMCAQQRLRSACAFTQSSACASARSDPSLYGWHGEALGACLLKVCPVKTFRLHRCAGWSKQAVLSLCLAHLSFYKFSMSLLKCLHKVWNAFSTLKICCGTMVFVWKIIHSFST